MNDSVTSIHPQGCAIIASVHFYNYIIPNRNCTHQTVTSLSSPSSDTSLLRSLCMHGAALSTSHGWNFVKCPMSVFIFWRFCLRLSALHFFFRLHVVCVSVRSLYHPFVDGHLSHRCLLASANAALVVVCILSVNILLCSLGHDSRREIADHMS